jgi:hypothetical protein
MALDFMFPNAFSQIMRLNQFQIESLCKKIINGLEEKNLVQFRDGKDKAFKKAVEVLEIDFDAEKNLEAEVHKRLDALESEQSEGFDRHKMFKMLKSKMAEEKGIIL